MDEPVEIVAETVTRQDGQDVTDMLIAESDTVRHVGVVEIGMRGKFVRYDPSKPFVPVVGAPTDGHTAERHRVLRSPPESHRGE